MPPCWAYPHCRSLPPLSADELGTLLDKETLTKADHLKLADYYSAEAEQLRKKSKRHAALAVRYGRAGSLPPKAAHATPGMSKHCEDLSQSLSNAAKASQELGTAHRAMADQSQ